MPASKIRRSSRSGLRSLLGLSIVALTLVEAIPSSHGRSRSSRKHPEPPSAAAQEASAPTADARVNAAFLYVKGVGILRLQDGLVSPVLQTQAPLRDMQLDAEGAVWASLRDVGVIRHVGGKILSLNQESFAKLAIRSPSDVWAINDSHGSVVHYDGNRWKTVRTRNSLAGAFEDNRLLDVVTDGRAVWVSSWNGLWRVTGGRWTRVEPPAMATTSNGPEADAAPTPAFPLSLLVSRPGLIACYLSGCFVSTEAGWQPSHWPADKAHLQSAGSANLVAGTGADGKTIVISRLDGSSEPSKSEALPANGINDIAIDATGRVWVATVAALILLDASGRTLQQWKPAAVDGQPGEIERVVIAGAGPKQLPAR